MSSDWYAPIKRRQRVDLADVMMRAALYLTDCASVTEMTTDLNGEKCATVRVRGSVSNPWRKEPDPQPSRWFELRIVQYAPFDKTQRAVRVTTRMADPLTMDLAAAFARRLALEWGTEVRS